MANIFSIFLLLCLLSNASLLGTQQKPKSVNFQFHSVSVEDRPNEFRLNDTFIPSNYDLELKFPVENVEAGGVKGKVKIFGMNKVSRKSISLHISGNSINDSSIEVVRRRNGSDLMTVAKVENTEEGLMTIFLEKQIKADEEIQLQMHFIAEIGDCDAASSWSVPVSAVCKAKYKTDSGEIREMFLSSNSPFQRVFPSFNEPHLRATYDVTIVRRREQTALFNSELVTSLPAREEEGWILDKFAKTVPLPPNEITIFLASHLASAEAKFGNKPARVHIPDFSGQSLGINDTATKVGHILTTYDQLFGGNSLQKLDLVVVPTYNIAWRRTWGLYFCQKQPTLLPLDYPHKFDDLHPIEDGLDGDRETNQLTLLLTHHWLGLDEPLQRFLQYIAWESLGVDMVGKETAILRDIQLSMTQDVSHKAQPFIFSAHTSFGIRDSINRGAPLLRMIDNFLTRATMTKALRFYRSKVDKKGAASPKDLIDSLQEAANADKRSLPAPPEEIMRTWWEQSGLPLVKVEVVNKTHISFSQQRFKIKRKMFKSDTNATWYIPVTYVTQDEPTQLNIIWLETENKAKIVEHDVSKWILVNPNATGYFRTLYDKHLLQVLISTMETTDLMSGMSTSQLLDDYNTFPARFVGEQQLFNLTKCLGRSTHLGVWNTRSLRNNFLPFGFADRPKSPIIFNYLESRIGSVLEKIGIESSAEPGSMKILRKTLLQFSCSIEGPSCEPYAKKIFQEWKANPKSYVPETDFECGVVSFGGQPAFDFVFQRYDEERRKTFSNTRDLPKGLTCATEPSVIQGFLNKTLYPHEFGLGPDSFAFSNYFMNLYLLLTNLPKPRKEIIPFLTSHFNQTEQALGSSRTVRKVIDIADFLGRNVMTREQLDEVKTFLKLVENRMKKEDRRQAKRVLRKIVKNISWMDRVGNEILSLASSISKNPRKAPIPISYLFSF